MARIRLDEHSWQRGFDAGLRAEASTPVPEGLDELSWYSGYLDGQAYAEEQEPPSVLAPLGSRERAKEAPPLGQLNERRERRRRGG